MERIIDIEKLTLKQYAKSLELYGGCADGLIKLPCPEHFKLGRRKYPLPQSMDEFCENITYGQRMYLGRKEENDIDVIFRQVTGYFYPIVTKKAWVEKKALTFAKNIITCRIIDLYPIAMHLISLVSQMAEREQKMLHREPTKTEKIAGIDKLSVFAELSALDFLRTSMGITIEEVLLTPYNECFVRFMMAKETDDYQKRYMERLKEEHEHKNRKK
jgi:hypothetical protein